MTVQSVQSWGVILLDHSILPTTHSYSLSAMSLTWVIVYNPKSICLCQHVLLDANVPGYRVFKGKPWVCYNSPASRVHGDITKHLFRRSEQECRFIWEREMKTSGKRATQTVQRKHPSHVNSAPTSVQHCRCSYRMCTVGLTGASPWVCVFTVSFPLQLELFRWPGKTLWSTSPHKQHFI